jgi:Sec-independent protein translocase protein TatA
LVLVLAIGVLAIGPHRLPATGKLVGKGLRNFQRGLREARDAVEAESAPNGPHRSPHPTRLID